MSIVQSLTSNPLLKNMLLKQLKSAFAENDLKLITISLDNDGELDFKVYTTPQVVTDETEFLELQNTLLNGLE